MTAVPARVVPVVFAAFGVGMTAGNIIVPYFAERAVMRAAGFLLFGWTSTGWVGCGLALVGFVAWVVALITERSRVAVIARNDRAAA